MSGIFVKSLVWGFEVFQCLKISECPNGIFQWIWIIRFLFGYWIFGFLWIWIVDTIKV